jgi:hypothetical protein
MSTNSFKVKNSLVLTPKDLTTLVSPEAGDIACDINDNNKIKKYDAVTSSWSEVGSGASSLDSIFQLIGDDVASWSSGNNASFLGGGSLAGTFATESAAPLNGLQSYKYTQAAGSLNDYIASPAKSVASRFKGQTCILSFPFNYNGNANDIEVVIYDATNSAVIPTSTFISASSNTSVLTSYVTIPLTCSSIRVGFKVAVANSGKILNFDDVQLSQTSIYTPQPLDQSSYMIRSGLTLGVANVTGALSGTGGSLGVYSYNSSTGVYTILKKCKINLSFSATTSANASAVPRIQIASLGTVGTSHTNAASGNGESVSWTGILEAGETFQFLNAAGTISIVYVSVLASATSDQVVLAPETFSTDTAALTYAGSASYTLSTLSNAPVGTFITFTYAINTNTRTQTTSTAPSQSTADMNANGIQIFTRAYNAASTAGNPACIAIQIGKGLKGKSLDLYKSAGKVTSGSLDNVVISSTGEIGATYKGYNEQTGILTIDAAVSGLSTNTNRLFYYDDNTSQNSGYLVINASKNPALTGFGLNTVAVRATSTAGGAIGTGATLQTFSEETFDTGNNWNGTVFTAPENGYYKVDATLVTQAVTLTTSQALNILIYKNGSSFSISLTRGNGTSTAYPASISDLVYLSKGDTLSIYANSAVATAQLVTPTYNYISIMKVSL